jgi:hypothetical protein
MENMIRNRVKILIAACLLLVGLGVIIFLLSPHYKNYSIHETPHLASDFATIQGQSIYGYSGISFYKSAIDNPAKVTVLSSGFHLPVPKSIHWAGDEGAVLTFTDQGAARSLLEAELQSRGKEVNEQSLELVWYFDFKSHTLQLVDEAGFASPAYYYSPAKHGFYYIKYGKPVLESHGFENATLAFYSTKSFSSQTVSEAVGNEEATTYIGPCKNAETVCLVKDLNGKYSLYAVENGKQEKVGKTYDHLVATASPTVFIGSMHDNTESSESAEDELLLSSYYFVNPATEKDTRVSKNRVANNSFIANTDGDGFFYIFEPTPEDPDNDISLLTGAKNVFKTPKTKQVKFANIDERDESSSSIAVIDPVSKNDSGFMLFRDVATTYLIAPQGYDYVSAEQSSQKMQNTLQPCFAKYTEYHEYSEELSQLKVGVVYDANYRKNIESFSNCVATTNPGSQIGHDFIFVGLSPIDGRFVTN